MQSLPILGHREGDGPLAPVAFLQELCATPETLRTNISAALSMQYKPFTDLLEAPHDRVISIVGSAPSLHQHYQEITGDIMACNAAHDFLIAKNIKPKWGMMFDADAVLTKFMTPTEGITYLLASRCHPALFEQFQGSDVVVWHAMGDEVINDLLADSGRHEPIVNGGSAAVVRGLGLAIAMGYKEMHLFGVDSSFPEEVTHIRQSLVPETAMQIWCDGKWFKTTSWLAVQAEDFKLLAPAFRDAGIKIVIHGNGLIPHIARGLGFEVIGDT